MFRAQSAPNLPWQKIRNSFFILMFNYCTSIGKNNIFTVIWSDITIIIVNYIIKSRKGLRTFPVPSTDAHAKTHYSKELEQKVIHQTSKNQININNSDGEKSIALNLFDKLTDCLCLKTNEGKCLNKVK